MKNTLAFALSLLLLSSCGDPLGRTYNKERLREDFEAIYDRGGISEEERQLLSQYLSVAPLAGRRLEGLTYRQILDSAKALRPNTDLVKEAVEKTESDKK